MITLKIKGKEYNLKFGYKSFKKSNILNEVVSMQKKIKNPNENTGENTAESAMENIEILERVLELSSKLVLAALQKYHEEFRADYKREEEVQKIIDKVDDLMDDYMDEEDSMSIMDLFMTLTEELFNNGFLSKKSPKLEEAAEKMDATVIPIDHKQSEN